MLMILTYALAYAYDTYAQAYLCMLVLPVTSGVSTDSLTPANPIIYWLTVTNLSLCGSV